MRRAHSLAPILLAGLLVACGQAAVPPATTPLPTDAPTAAALPTDAPATDAPAAIDTPSATPAATRAGSEYILLLPREAAVPSDWAMTPPPAYETRQPGPEDTYHFACRDLPARSIGRASVGYRHLEGLPSVHVEYVIYPTAVAAADALADMQQASAECGDFTIGAGEGATAASFAPLEFPAYGDAGFAAALSTTSPVTGELLTHMIKVRRGHVVIGISHANYADGPAPDAALTEALVALAVRNLEAGPAAPGP